MGYSVALSDNGSGLVAITPDDGVSLNLVAPDGVISDLSFFMNTSGRGVAPSAFISTDVDDAGGFVGSFDDPSSTIEGAITVDQTPVGTLGNITFEVSDGASASRASLVITGYFDSEGEGGADANNLLSGGAGMAEILAGSDTIISGFNADTLSGFEGRDFIFGQSGSDVLYGGGGQDLIYGNTDDDIIFGEDGNDQIFGGQGNDFILGGDGSDFLEGNRGNDTILSGAGNDTIMYHAPTFKSDGNDVIEDFVFGQDFIGLRNHTADFYTFTTEGADLLMISNDITETGSQDIVTLVGMADYVGQVGAFVIDNVIAI